MKILLSAYACDPANGSEERNGWSLAVNLAKLGKDVWVLTRPSGREAIEKSPEASALPNLRIVYVEPPDWSRPLWGGTFGWAAHYVLWQRAALPAAIQLEKKVGFDVVHHATWGTLKGGSELWRLGKPFLFGPVGGGQTAPVAFKDYFKGYWGLEVARTFFTKRLMPLAPGLKGALSHAVRVFAANRETFDLVRRLGARDVEFLVDVGLPDGFIPEACPRREPRKEMTLLWVGRLDVRKAPMLALEVMSRLDPKLPIRLRILGSGALEDQVRREIDRRGLASRVDFPGRLPWSAMEKAMMDSDALLFTSLRESGGVQLLEAMAKGLPIIALDHQGVTDIVPDGAGVKAAVTTPEESVAALAEGVELLWREPELRLEMGRRGWERARLESWNNRARKFVACYENALAA